jgi:hypothetical protein
MAMCAGIAVFWLAPIAFSSVIASRERDTFIGGLWRQYWFVPYLLSLLAWFLPRAWFRTFPWEGSGRIYEALGVRWLKQFLIGGDRMNRTVRKTAPAYRVYAHEALRQRIFKDTCVSEKIHVVMLLFALWPALFAAAVGWWPYAALLTVANVVVNLYPILVQRYTRARLALIERRMGRSLKADAPA